MPAPGCAPQITTMSLLNAIRPAAASGCRRRRQASVCISVTTGAGRPHLPRQREISDRLHCQAHAPGGVRRFQLNLSASSFSASLAVVRALLPSLGTRCDDAQRPSRLSGASSESPILACYQLLSPSNRFRYNSDGVAHSLP